MQYKFEFMQDDRVPKEYLERDLERNKMRGWDEIMNLISEHYPYTSHKSADGKEVHSITLMCCSASKFNQAMLSLSTALSFHPEFKNLVKEIIDQMFYPEVDEK